MEGPITWKEKLHKLDMVGLQKQGSGKKTSRNQIHITLFTHQALFTHQEEHTQPTHSPLLLCKLLGSLELWG